VSTAPETELNMGMGRLAIAPCVTHGIGPTLSCDTVSLNSGDLFAQMRLALAYLRQTDNDPINQRGAMPERLLWRAADALRWATVNGADALGLGDRVGSLTPGKDADLIVVGGPAPGPGPLVEPEAILVFQASVDSVRHVLIAGRWAKRDGALVGVDGARLRAEVDTSTHGILGRMRTRAPVLPPPPLVPPALIEEFAATNFADG
jgi:cytosine/adenosine deaminase-related metal-dependent hydrolase